MQHKKAPVKNKFYSNTASLNWNTALRLAVASHMTSFDQLNFLISAQHSYARQKFVLESAMIETKITLSLNLFNLFKKIFYICKKITWHRSFLLYMKQFLTFLFKNLDLIFQCTYIITSKALPPVSILQ